MKYLLLTIVAAIVFVSNVSGQNIPDDLQNRIKQLESQLLVMQAELEKLKKAVEPAAVAKSGPVKPEPSVEKKAEQDKKLPGLELGNGVRVVPYGTVYFNLFANDKGTNNSDIPLFATPTGKGNTSASVRQTRFGLRIEGGKIKNARVSGIVEVDFYGGSPAISTGENFGVVRMRLANARLDWENTSVVVGQDWIPFAPNNPVSIADAAIPQFAAAGNPWARLPQVKIEQRWNRGKIVWQGAVLAPQTGDSSSTASFLQQPNSGSLSRVPFVQGRISFNDKDWFATKKNGSLGLSGHFGRSRVTPTSGPAIEEDINSYGIAVDWNSPLHKRVSWTGEVFYGRNLAGFQAGVFQNYNTDFATVQNNNLVASGVRGIKTIGGWTQIGFTPDWNKDKMAFYGSVGLDDPDNVDFISFKPRDFRSRNLAWALDAIYKFTPQFQIGLEFRQLNTTYTLSGRKRANHLNLGATYSF